MSPWRIARIVLAAGAGERMGSAKALLSLGAKTALERILDLRLATQELEDFIVMGAEYEAVDRLVQSLGKTAIYNEDWQTGRTNSLKKGLSAAGRNFDFYLLHPVDLPLVTSADYQALDHALRQKEDAEGMLVLSHNMRRGHPLIFDVKRRSAILKLGDDESPRPLLQGAADIQYVVVDNPWILKDLNHPEDLQAARRYLAAKGRSTPPENS